MDPTKSIIRACETVRNMGMQWEDLKLTRTSLDYWWPTLEKESEQDEQYDLQRRDDRTEKQEARRLFLGQCLQGSSPYG